ncbi:MAG: glycosyltransferase family 4 protein [Planctomycetota bacterium]|jgi:glycosyltransferase involved in cell wall biosynthesis
MRVILLNQAFYPDHAATAQHAHDLARHLVARGHDVAVVASRSIYGSKGAALPKREVVDGIEVHRVGKSLFGKSTILARMIDFLLFYLLATVKVMTVKRPDVIVPFSTPPFIALVGWALKVVKRCKTVYWVMELYPDVPIAFGLMKADGLGARVLERTHRFCLRRADRAVALGRCMRDHLVGKGISPEKVALIPPWADIDELEPLPRDENPLRVAWGLDDKLVVMYSGNLGLAHDIDTMRGAMVALNDRDDIRFVFVGGGKLMTQLQGDCEEHKLANVIFKPYQPRESIRASLSLADIHLISQAESMTGLLVPSKLYGIMAAGRASVFIGDARAEVGRVLLDNDAGKVIEVGDVDGLVQTLTGLADDPDACRRMGDAARRAMADRYDRRHACEAWERLLTECVSGRKADPADDSPTPANATQAQGTKP